MWSTFLPPLVTSTQRTNVSPFSTLRRDLRSEACNIKIRINFRSEHHLILSYRGSQISQIPFKRACPPQTWHGLHFGPQARNIQVNFIKMFCMWLYNRLFHTGTKFIQTKQVGVSWSFWQRLMAFILCFCWFAGIVHACLVILWPSRSKNGAN